MLKSLLSLKNLSIIYKRTYVNKFEHIFFKKFKMLENVADVDDDKNAKNTAVVIKESKSAIRHRTNLEMKEERKANLKKRRQAKRENKAVGISNDIPQQTTYYFENGLRKVYPYYFGWHTTCKERWFNKTLLEIYSNEFR